MRSIISSAVIIGFVASLGSSASGVETGESIRIHVAHGNYWERVQAGFDDMLSHEPYAGPTETTVQLPTPDPAADMINDGLSPLYDRIELVNAGKSKL